jgi:hypothetical protein
VLPGLGLAGITYCPRGSAVIGPYRIWFAVECVARFIAKPAWGKVPTRPSTDLTVFWAIEAWNEALNRPSIVSPCYRPQFCASGSRQERAGGFEALGRSTNDGPSPRTSYELA